MYSAGMGRFLRSDGGVALGGGQQKCQGSWLHSASWELPLKDRWDINNQSDSMKKQTKYPKGELRRLKTKTGRSLGRVLPATALGDMAKVTDGGSWTFL